MSYAIMSYAMISSQYDVASCLLLHTTVICTAMDRFHQDYDGTKIQKVQQKRTQHILISDIITKTVGHIDWARTGKSRR